jgi:hypothetical protein
MTCVFLYYFVFLVRTVHTFNFDIEIGQYVSNIDRDPMQWYRMLYLWFPIVIIYIKLINWQGLRYVLHKLLIFHIIHWLNFFEPQMFVTQFNDITCFIYKFWSLQIISNRVTGEIWHVSFLYYFAFCTYIHLISILKLTVCFQISIVTMQWYRMLYLRVSIVIIYIKLINWQGLRCLA